MRKEKSNGFELRVFRSGSEMRIGLMPVRAVRREVKDPRRTHSGDEPGHCIGIGDIGRVDLHRALDLREPPENTRPNDRMQFMSILQQTPQADAGHKSACSRGPTPTSTTSATTTAAGSRTAEQRPRSLMVLRSPARPVRMRA